MRSIYYFCAPKVPHAFADSFSKQRKNDPTHIFRGGGNHFTPGSEPSGVLTPNTCMLKTPVSVEDTGVFMVERRGIES